jgi:hypothetical protein
MTSKQIIENLNKLTQEVENRKSKIVKEMQKLSNCTYTLEIGKKFTELEEELNELNNMNIRY